jgi:hypothetical protein
MDPMSPVGPMGLRAPWTLWAPWAPWGLMAPDAARRVHYVCLCLCIYAYVYVHVSSPRAYLFSIVVRTLLMQAYLRKTGAKSLLKVDLLRLAGSLGIEDLSGTKADLIRRIAMHVSDDDEDFANSTFISEHRYEIDERIHTHVYDIWSRGRFLYLPRVLSRCVYSVSFFFASCHRVS